MTDGSQMTQHSDSAPALAALRELVRLNDQWTAPLTPEFTLMDWVALSDQLDAAWSAARAALSAPEQDSRDAMRLDWLDEHCDGATHSGYGADDMWWKLIYNDGAQADGGTIRDAIDAALASQPVEPTPSET